MPTRKKQWDQPDIFDLLADPPAPEPAPPVPEPEPEPDLTVYCRCSVLTRMQTGGSVLDKATGWWVHAQTSCLLPMHPEARAPRKVA